MKEDRLNLKKEMLLTMDIKDLYEYTQRINCPAILNEPMKNHTSFKIGGPADIFIRPDSIDKLKLVISFCVKNQIKYVVIGNGSNLLVKDEGYRGAIVNISSRLENIRLENKTEIVCTAGTTIARLCYFAMQNSLTGLEFAWGIPGNVGGSVYMNAGAYDGEIKDVIKESYYIDREGNEGMMTKDEMKLSYRHSIYAENGYCVIGARFQLMQGNKTEIKKKMDDFKQRRISKQPLEYPNAGSTFRRPPGNYVGALVDKSGLRGTSYGGAQVSEKHSGFIINKGNATYSDVINLINMVQKQVFEKTGYRLEPEIKTI